MTHPVFLRMQKKEVEMKFRRYVFLTCLFFLPVILISCASPLKRKLTSDQKINYRGSIIPVNDPVQLMYKPVKAKFKILSVVLARVENREISQEPSIYGYYHVTRFGDQLLWNIKVTKMEMGDQSFSSLIPLVDARLLTDHHGNTVKLELALPYFDKSKMGKPAYYKLYHNVKRNITHQFSKSYPRKPVRSGDLIHCFSDREIKEMLAQAFITPKPDSGTRGIRDINYTIDGWGNYEGKQVLIASVDDELYIEYPNHHRRFKFKVNGYIILNKSTYHHVKVEIKVAIEEITDSSSPYRIMSLETINDLSSSLVNE